MIDQINSLDISVFQTINSWHNPFWDIVMIGISSLWLWFPLYGFLLFVGFKKYQWKVWRLALAAALVIALADQVSSSFIKPKVARLRPCHDETINQTIHQPGGCGGKFGFVSSHAANTFGIATLIVLLWGWKSWSTLLLWSVLVSYSRVYLGVHYPTDVIAGSLLGAIVATIVWFLYFVWLHKKNFNPAKS
ncbi:MAG: phosphatase PAP2 family protein [Cytophagales bacterium]